MAAIWDDPDVGQIIELTTSDPDLRLYDLEDRYQELMLAFIEVDQQVTGEAPSDLVVAACVAGIRFVEEVPDALPGTNARGWKKFVIFMTGANARILADNHGDQRAAAVAGWVLEALAAVGVEPDGHATALGSMYSSTMGIPGGSAVLDPASGRFTVRGGDDGRRLAGL